MNASIATTYQTKTAAIATVKRSIHKEGYEIKSINTREKMHRTETRREMATLVLGYLGTNAPMRKKGRRKDADADTRRRATKDADADGAAW
jgi:hypothetical protein